MRFDSNTIVFYVTKQSFTCISGYDNNTIIARIIADHPNPEMMTLAIDGNDLLGKCCVR